MWKLEVLESKGDIVFYSRRHQLVVRILEHQAHVKSWANIRDCLVVTVWQQTHAAGRRTQKPADKAG
jgi:hypothetical protein